MRAEILAGDGGIAAAVEALRRGDVIGLPTETVYGLAGDAFSPRAAARIFEAKGRPMTDPLIVHLPEAAWLERVARFDSPGQQQRIAALASAFWPGPLTMILKKQEAIPDLVTAGMERVAVRVTSHSLFRKVLYGLGSPLAAPSANRFGRISPTSAEDVRIELGDKISLILDGGPCRHGVESTIITISEEGIEILRPGPIGIDQLKEYGHVLLPDQIMNTPGSLPGHYAPEKELHIIESDISQYSPSPRSGLLAFTEPAPEITARYSLVEILSPAGDLCEAAANFYGALRRLDKSNADIIYAEALPERGIGIAVMDRMRRAEYGSRLGLGLKSPVGERGLEQ